MKKHLKRALSLVLAFTTVFGIGTFQAVKPQALAPNIVETVQIGATYMIRNAETGLYMTALGDNTVEQRGFTGASNQQWKTFNELSSIWDLDGLDIRPLSNFDVLLDMENNQSNADVNVRSARDGFFDAPSNQMWEFINYSNGSFQIKSARNERIIGLNGNRTMMREVSGALNLRWEFIKIGSVTYNYAINGGTSSTKTSDTLFEGAAVDLAPTAEKFGWEFVGWNTDPNATTKLTSLTMGYEDLKLYAIFKKTGNVDFVDYNGTTVVTRSVPYTAYNTTTGVTVAAPAQNSATGLTARGWGVGSVGNAPVVVAVGDAATIATSTYYGLYEKSVLVSFDAAGGQPSPLPQTGKRFFNAADIANPVNPMFTMPAEPSRERYTFGGWKEGENLYPAWANVSFSQDTNLAASWNEIRVDGITLSQNALVMGESDTTDLEAFVQPANATFPEYRWNSSDETVVTVDQNGNVTAVNSGRATITATTEEGGFKANCEVTVMFVATPVASISISKSQAQLIVGNSLQLSAQITPTDATVDLMEWNSSNAAVATVDQNGFVQSVGVGTAIVSARSVQGGKQATCEIVVAPVRVTSIKLDYDEISLSSGQSMKLEATVLPENSTNKTVNWQSSDNAVATVDQTGNVTACGTGTTEITAIAADGGLTAVATVTVTTPVTSIALSPDNVEVYGGEQIMFEAAVLPVDATNRSVTWSSSDSGVATVDANGFVTTGLANQDTTVTITATAKDGSGIKGQVAVKILVNQKTANDQAGGGATAGGAEAGQSNSFLGRVWDWIVKWIFFGWAWQKKQPQNRDWSEVIDFTNANDVEQLLALNGISIDTPDNSRIDFVVNGNTITITTGFNYSGQFMGESLNSTSYISLFEDGIKNWAGTYKNIYGRYNVTVNVVIDNTRDEAEKINAILDYYLGDPDGPRPAGTLGPTTTKNNRIWMPKGDDRTQIGYTYSAIFYRRTTTHEFGHVLGLVDVYNQPPPQNKHTSIMNNHFSTPVQRIDIEALIYAYASMKEQIPH